MPRDTPPTEKRPKPREQPKPIIEREKTPPPQQVRADPVPEPVQPKSGPSETIEEAFLRAGATTIEAAPVHRDFQKETVKFVPSVVKRRPPPKKPAPKTETKAEEPEKPTEKSFATTLEDAEDEDADVTPRVNSAEVKATPIAPSEPTLKRPLEVEKKVEPETAPPAAPPKRRRMVNAAPDV